MYCVYFPIVLTISLHIPILYRLILVISIEWNHDAPPSVISSLFSAAKPLPQLLQTIPTLTPILYTWWYSSSIIIHHSHYWLMSSTALSLPAPAGLWAIMMWTSPLTPSVQTWVRDENGEKQEPDGLTMRTTPMRYIMKSEKCNQIEVNQEKEMKWNEKSASFYIIMYFFTYNLKYESLPLGGNDLNFFI